MAWHRIDSVIVGGGQAGLAISYYLSREGREHVVLERAAAVANAWRNQRWDSFTLVTPNFQVRMPGAEYNGSDPYGFMSLAEVVKYFDEYVERFDLPVHCKVEVFSVEKVQEGYLVRTSEGADNVVIATRPFPVPEDSSFQRRDPCGHFANSLDGIPESLMRAGRRSIGGRNRAVRCPDCRRDLPKRKESLSLDRQCGARASTLSWKGH